MVSQLQVLQTTSPQRTTLEETLGILPGEFYTISPTGQIHAQGEYLEFIVSSSREFLANVGPNGEQKPVFEFSLRLVHGMHAAGLDVVWRTCSSRQGMAMHKCVPGDLYRATTKRMAFKDWAWFEFKIEKGPIPCFTPKS